MDETTIVEDLTDSTWETRIERGELPSIVMFHSPTCPFCKQIEPYFRDFSGEYAGRILFARLDVSTNPWTVERYAVRQTPTFKFFCSGKPVQELVGAAFPALLKKNIDEFLKHGEGCARSSSEIDYEITGYA
ncbi:thioredoxin family protein [Methanofollis fontis]|uniref:Thiol reductase thioredoxin n=1 Tax=Methanofollis fontis TaxID=2052832 RepID=A0A483CSH9_9EURY|nr:thioredoxin family protein [Methanofollis fontis]TAJ44045.1 thiol reductase thioredoxin [Methanofollis fontis]